MPSKTSFHASRYVHYFLLLTKAELLEFLPDGYYVALGKVLADPFLSKEKVAEASDFSAIGFALSKDHFSFVNIPNRGQIAKENLPVMHIKPFTFLLTSNGKILEDTSGVGAIDFGLSFSYPILFQKEEKVVFTKDHFEEAKIFMTMRSFIRKKTKPAKLLLHGEKLQTSFRIGNEARDLAASKISQVEGLTLL